MCITMQRMQAYSAYRHISVVFNAMTTLQLKSANNYILLIQQHRSKPLHYTRSHPNCSLSRSPFSHYSQQHIFCYCCFVICAVVNLCYFRRLLVTCVCVTSVTWFVRQLLYMTKITQYRTIFVTCLTSALQSAVNFGNIF